MTIITPSTTETTRTWPLWISVAVLALTALIHIAAGSPDYLRAVGTAALPPEADGLAIALWHVTSVILVLLPTGLIWASRQERRAGRPIITAVWLVSLAFVAIMLTVDIAAGGVISPLVQWTLFVPAAALLPWVRLRPSQVSPQQAQ